MRAVVLTPPRLKCPVVVRVTADRVVPADVSPDALEIVVVAVPERAVDIRKVSLRELDVVG